MTIATALVTGNEPLPQLAEKAVQQALGKAGLTHANGVLLFLTPEFSRNAQAAVTAAARAAQCTQVDGGIASGVLTESGWTLDRPAAAVMVFGGNLTPRFPCKEGLPVLSYAGGVFPPEWDDSVLRFGSTFSGNFAAGSAHGKPATWQQSRLTETQRFCAQFNGAVLSVGVSSGLQLLGQPMLIESCNGFDLEKLGGQAALKSLNRVLPAELRREKNPQLHHLMAIRVDATHGDHALADGTHHPIALIAANADNSLTLAERVIPGQYLAWGIRQPVTAENDMRQCIERLSRDIPKPACALMFSCIGRGPYFYGSEDRDLNILCERFPGLPVLGTYGTGQIAPAGGASGNNRPLQNAVVTALIGAEHDKPNLSVINRGKTPQGNAE
jgi:small ligand-binding sensory domain FIST